MSTHFDLIPDDLIEEIILKLKYPGDIIDFVNTFEEDQNLLILEKFNNIGNLRNNHRLFKELLRIYFFDYYQTLLNIYDQNSESVKKHFGTWYQLFEMLTGSYWIIFGSRFEGSLLISDGDQKRRSNQKEKFTPEDILFHDELNNPKLPNILYEIIFARNYPDDYQLLKDTQSSFLHPFIEGMQKGPLRWYFIFMLYIEVGIHPEYFKPKLYYDDSHYLEVSPYELLLTINNSDNPVTVMENLFGYRKIKFWMQENIEHLGDLIEDNMLKDELIKFFLSHLILPIKIIRKYKEIFE